MPKMNEEKNYIEVHTMEVKMSFFVAVATYEITCLALVMSHSHFE